MGLVLRYARQTRTGKWQYRRRYPTALTDIIQRTEFKRALGDTEPEALRAYPRIDIEFQRIIAEAERQKANQDEPQTPLEVHRQAERRAREISSGVVFIGGRQLEASDPRAVDIIRDSYLSRLEHETNAGNR
jgi:hypothetical protein